LLQDMKKSARNGGHPNGMTSAIPTRFYAILRIVGTDRWIVPAPPS
jgi:hypothetical protein